MVLLSIQVEIEPHDPSGVELFHELQVSGDAVHVALFLHLPNVPNAVERKAYHLKSNCQFRDRKQREIFVGECVCLWLRVSIAR